MRVGLALCCVLGCSAHHSGVASSPDAGAPCSASACSGSTFEACVDGITEPEPCTAACSATLGCVACDPSITPVTCNGSDVVACNSDGSLGQTMATCGTGQQCTAGACSNTCTADGVDLVYVVDEANHFMSFDPRLLPNDPFTLIGTLACPTTKPSILVNESMVMPMSMSVDRNGVAWVLYTSGELFQVSLQNAGCLPANNTVGANGMNLFGMGFVTDAAMGTTEKLYMAGGSDNPASSPRQLAYDDTHGGNLTPTIMGTISATSNYSPELTGTNEAKLYGFFPNTTAIPYVQEIDKASGSAVGSAWNLGSAGLGQITDWAFAQWGGVFYVFVTTKSGNTRDSTVRTIDRATGAYAIALDNVAYFIDGAGVSTCAPASIQ